MKIFYTGFVLASGLTFTTLTAPAQSIDCDTFPNNLAIQPDWTPTCYRLNNFQANSVGSVRYADPVNLVGHLRFDDCYFFGRPVAGDGSIALYFGQNVPDSTMAHAIATPIGQMLAVDFSTAGAVDMIRVWTWDSTGKTMLDSAVALPNAARLDDGYFHAVSIKWSGSSTRLKVWIDGVQRINLIYDAITNLLEETRSCQPGTQDPQ